MNATEEPQTSEDLTADVAEVFAEEPQTPETQQPETKTPQTPQLTPDQIRESVRAGVADAQPQAPAKQYTPEELNKLFNVWEPNEDLIERVRAGGADGLKAMVEMRDGLAKQFGTLLQYQIEIVKQDLMTHMSPALTFAQEQAAARDREDFFSQNDDLRQHEQLTQTVFDALKAQGYRAKDKAEAYKTLADRTRALLGGNGNGAGTGQPSGAQRTNPTQTKRPAQLSSGSQAGGGGPSAPAAPFPGAEVFM